MKTQTEFLIRGVHPNAIPVTGTAAFLDVPSDSNVHAINFETQAIELGPRLLIPKNVAEEHLEQLVGQALCAQTEPVGERAAYTLHAMRTKVGVITAASIDGNRLCIHADIWALDFPDVLAAIEEGGLGMCVNMSWPILEKFDESTVRLTRAIFTGVALMRKDKCGFRETEVKVFR